MNDTAEVTAQTVIAEPSESSMHAKNTKIEAAAAKVRSRSPSAEPRQRIADAPAERRAVSVTDLVFFIIQPALAATDEVAATHLAETVCTDKTAAQITNIVRARSVISSVLASVGVGAVFDLVQRVFVLLIVRIEIAGSLKKTGSIVKIASLH